MFNAWQQKCIAGSNKSTAKPSSESKGLILLVSSAICSWSMGVVTEETSSSSSFAEATEASSSTP
ncbi:hypothetical protein DPMN_123926 [Dreissena polymorpha]|uniref:Uncharacterized protein n=1 Tax=Dreissena polymorpha TaxID=45954 RepID=A0A9D4JRR1_DREPO|nr:hypothetical protein DPMN_123926 [Dreissena polymorpha]